MPSSCERFDLVDLHDAPVVASGRTGREVWLELRYANLAKDHPSNDSGRPIRVGPCTLTFQAAVTAEARLFDDRTRTWVRHPAPDMPIDDAIIHAREEIVGEEQRYVLDGMHTAGWSEWHIRAEGFTLTWSEILGDAWYARLDE